MNTAIAKRPRPRYWILTDEKLHVSDRSGWSIYMRDTDVTVAEDSFWYGGKRVTVLTSFVGLDDVRSGEPLVYSTVVEGGAYHGHAKRYASRREALIGHMRICEAAGKCGK